MNNLDKKIKKKKKLKEQTKRKYDIRNMDGLKYLETVNDESIHLILTDPPYIISRETGMNTHYNNVKENEKKVLNL